MMLAIFVSTITVLGPVAEDPILRTTLVARGDLAREVRLPATVEPWEEATLVAHVTGYVKEVLVREGALVSRGELLATIDVPLMSQELAQKEAAVLAARARAAEAETQIRARRSAVGVRRAGRDRARAEVDLRRIQLERLTRLQAEKAATQERIDDAQGALAIAEHGFAEEDASIAAAEADVAAAEAARESARAEQAVAETDLRRLQALAEYATIRCPYENAIVYDRLVDSGALVQADQTPLLHVMNIGRVRVRMSLDERDAPRVAAGSAVLLAPDARSLGTRRAEVTRVAKALDPSTRTMLVEVDLPNAEQELYPGMFLHADLEVFRRTGAVLVPAVALKKQGGETWVHLVEEGILKRRPVSLGVDDGIQCEVLSGLEEGAEVVLSGAESLVEGTKVRTRRESGS